MSDLWSNGLDEVKRLIKSGYALKTLYDLMAVDDLSPNNFSTLEDVVNQLEIHESEVREVRQSLSLRLRQEFLEAYKEGLKTCTERIV
jgi:hypothetical protein